MNRTFIILVLSALLALAPGCYSFKDASFDPNIKTFTVQFFENQAPNANPSISQTFTEDLKSKILRESNLTLRDAQGDVEFQGAITGYDVKPIAAQAGETSAQNRLTITVSVDFQNRVNDKDNWNSSFSRYADFDSNVNFSSIEDELVSEVFDQLLDDIFRRAFVNW